MKKYIILCFALCLVSSFLRAQEITSQDGATSESTQVDSSVNQNEVPHNDPNHPEILDTNQSQDNSADNADKNNAANTTDSQDSSSDDKLSSEDQDMVSNHASTEQEQLKGYQGFTNWLIKNKPTLEDVIKETSRNSKTKWFVAPNKNQAEVTESKESVTVSDDILYEVKKGDTIYSISKKYNLTVKKLLELNNLQEGVAINIGDKLKIKEDQSLSDKNTQPKDDSTSTETTTSPESSVDSQNNVPEENQDSVTSNFEDDDSQEPVAPEYKFYKIKKGDTLYQVAKNNKMTQKELADLNGLSIDSSLSVDSIIKVKSNYVTLPHDANNYTTVVNQDGKTITKDGFLWPVVGRLLISFGPQKGGITNEGINISAKKGTSVKSAQDGIVIYVGKAITNFGTIILIQHDHQWVSAYSHLDTVSVKKGDTVSKGQLIATVGTSGGVKEPQLHFELRKDITPMDPLVYLNSYR